MTDYSGWPAGQRGCDDGAAVSNRYGSQEFTGIAEGVLALDLGSEVVGLPEIEPRVIRNVLVGAALPDVEDGGMADAVLRRQFSSG